MDYILTQQDYNSKSIAATNLLNEKGVCLFDLTLSSTRLRSLAFNSRANKSHEKNYHSFVGEGGCGRWGIVANHQYLCGQLFY